MSATIAGVKFSDQLAALLDHAQASGFRIEADTRKGRPPGVMIYAPDKDVPPFSVQEERAKFNPSHYDNIRRQLYRSGCPLLPGDKRDEEIIESTPVILADSKEEALAKAPPGAVATELPGGIGIVDDSGGDLRKTLSGEHGPAFIAQVVLGLTAGMGAGEAEQHLVAAITKTAAQWVQEFSVDAINIATKKAAEEIRRQMSGEVNEALRMASEHEATASRAMKALERAEASEAQARADCKAALARAEAAEKKAADLEAAIRPLRNLLGSPS
jgi:hypothetical protein